MRESLGLPRAVVGLELTRSMLEPEWLVMCEASCCRGNDSGALTVTSEASVAGVIELVADPRVTWVAARGEINDRRGEPGEARFACGRRHGNVQTKGRTP